MKRVNVTIFHYLNVIYFRYFFFKDMFDLCFLEGSGRR